MNKILAVISLIFLIPLSIHCQDKNLRETGNFKSVSVSDDIRVELYKADKPYVEVMAVGTNPSNVVTVIEDNILNIDLEPGTEKIASVKVLVYYSELEKLEVRSGALIRSPEVVKAEKMFMEAKTNGKIELTVEIDQLEADVRQGATIVLRGEVEKQDINAYSGGVYSAYELEAQETNVKANSGGKAKVVATKNLNAVSSTKAYIGYKGNPLKISYETKLGGEVERVLSDN